LYGRAVIELAADSVNALDHPELSTINNAGFIAQAHIQVLGVTQSVAVQPTDSQDPSNTSTPQPENTPPLAESETLESLLAKLDRLVGLDRAKEEIKRQTALLKIQALRKASNLKPVDVTKHLLFVGNPGTGKTTVARLVSDIYRALGILSKGQLVECDRADLVAGYVGQTAIKTDEAIVKALGGVLFIDEAYALVSDDFGSEAIATLVKGMEDNRDELVVIAAGYTNRMHEFVQANPGLESRFHTTITFDDFTDDQLVEIFQRLCTDSDFSPTDETITKIREILQSVTRGEGFGNARFIRNLFESAITAQATRLSDIVDPSVADLRELRASDVSHAKR
jgi:SpoVK/Ycf46/Vps4 family AAA+-type ATPase